MSHQSATAATTLLIGDVTNSSSSAEFRNDVQLAQYRTEHNLELARDFIFTRKAAAGRKSSSELLKVICESFMPGAQPNRFVFIATYGHGKSHFAVATANYFGKAINCPEAEGVLARIKHALQDASMFGFFDSFKRNNKPYLILILRGDEPSDLQTKFFRAVDEALRADPEADIQAPFWYLDAERFLKGIQSDRGVLQQANAFLAERQLDLDVLLDRIKVQDATTFDITRELCLHLYHHTPDFGTGLSLKDGVEWLAKNLVGSDKQYGGVLILFDEFSSFVRDYALRIQSRPGAPLQDLLNGVEASRGKVSFVALAQRDPELIAKSLLGGDSLQSLTTQLNRLPKPQRYQLHSSLEEVLAAYLKQKREAWRVLMSHSGFARELGEANDLTFDVFSSRYSETLEWDLERFQEVVSQGCFPMHPATTALLSSVELETTNNPRSVLGFVTKHLDAIRCESAYEGVLPRWILPITLVDYFQEMLGEKSWNDYTDALSQAGGPDATLEQVAVLKAMLLQKAANVATRGSYNRVIAHFAGLSLERASTELQALATTGVTRYDQSHYIYTFWPAGKGANKVDQILSEKLSGCVLDKLTLERTTDRLKLENLVRDIPVPVLWGHQDDWHAVQMFVSRLTLTVENCRAYAIQKLHWLPEGEPKARGLILWAIAESPEDAAWLRDTSADILKRAFPGENIPLVIMSPGSAAPEFARQILRLKGLLEFSNNEIAEVGEEQYSALLQLTIDSLKTGFKGIRENSDIEVPTAFKARIAAVRYRDLEPVLGEVFKMAYSSGPKRWFAHYKNGSTKLRNATANVACFLLNNALDTPGIFANDNVSKEVSLQLKSEWGLLSPDLRIKHPTATSNVSEAWNVLDAEFSAGSPSRPAGQLVTRLLNVPFGFDYNTLSLLLASWIGFNRHDLEVSLQGQLRSIKTLADGRKPKEFVELLASVSIRKTDADAVKSRIRELLQRVDRETFSRPQAQEAMQLFSEALDRDDIDQKGAIQSACDKLRGAQERAVKYDEAALVIQNAAQTQRSITELGKALVSIRSLTFPETVKPDRGSPADLREILLERFGQVTESNCEQYQKLETLSDFSVHESQLNLIKTALTRLGLLDLAQRVADAHTALVQSKTRLEQEQQDRDSHAVLDAIETRGGFIQLRRNVSTVEALPLFSENVKKTARERLAQLRSEIASLDEFRVGIPARLADVRDLQSLDAVKSDLLKKLSLYEGSDGAPELQRALERCDELKEFFRAVDDCRREPLRTPVDVDKVTRQLNTLKDGQGLTEAQHAAVCAAIAAVEQHAIGQAESAIRWLEECENDAAEGKRSEELFAKLQSKPAFLGDEYRARLEALVAEVRAQTENKHVEASSLAALKGIAAKGSVADLQRQIANVESLPSPTDLVKKQVREKLAQLRAEIARLDEFRVGIPARLADVRDLQSLDAVKSDLLKKLSLYEGSDGAPELQRALERCDELKEFFRAVDDCRREPLRTPVDVDKVTRQLNTLKDGQGLTEAQHAAVCAAIAAVEQHAIRQAESAIRWLEECENDAAEGKRSEELFAKLQSKPAFLGDEYRARLEALVAEVRAQTENKHVEASSLAALKGIAAKGSVADLQRQIANVESLPSPTDLVKKQVREKLAQLRAEIAHLDEFRVGIPAKTGRCPGPAVARHGQVRSAQETQFV